MAEVDTLYLQRIGAAVTPAVMVPACGLIAVGLDNQIGRMTTRVRELGREFREGASEAARKDRIRQQVRLLDLRHALLVRALALDYLALLAFVLTSLVYLGQPLLDWPRIVPLGIFSFGVIALGVAAFLALSSLVVSRRTMRIEQFEVRELVLEEGRPSGR
ncbi:MAG: DUF2721 domain-containing protein [Myxococcales bacterium]